MVISDDEMQMQPMDVFLSAARRKQPFKSSRTLNQSQSQAISSDEKGEEQRYFIITRRLMKYLKDHNYEMYEKAKALTQECYEKKALGDPAYTSLMQILKRLRETVGETYWRRAQEYETDGEEAEMDTMMDGQQLTIARLQRELADKDREIKSMKAILKKIGVMANNMSEDSTLEDEEDPASTLCRADNGRKLREREHQPKGAADQYKNDSLKEQPKNSRPIKRKIIDLTNEIEQSSEEDSNDDKKPSSHHRNEMSNSDSAFTIKEQANESAAAAEAIAKAARREKDAARASLRNAKEDLEIQEDATNQAAVTLETWKGRFEELYELARDAGVDENRLYEIQHRHFSRRARQKMFDMYGF